MTDRRVLVVHGRDEGVKEAVVRFIEHLGLEVIVLHERASGGPSLTAKLNADFDVSFAVVLLTPDDIGCLKHEYPVPRARQSIVFEFGYLVGKLPRGRTCALYSPKIELPTDLPGAYYIMLDAQDGWKAKLAKELANAGIPVDATVAVGAPVPEPPTVRRSTPGEDTRYSVAPARSSAHPTASAAHMSGSKTGVKTFKLGSLRPRASQPTEPKE